MSRVKVFRRDPFTEDELAERERLKHQPLRKLDRVQLEHDQPRRRRRRRVVAEDR